MTIRHTNDLKELTVTPSGDPSNADTKATAVQNAIDEASTLDDSTSVSTPNGVAVFLPNTYVGYDFSQVTFDTDIPIYREGQRSKKILDAQAYGAAGDGSRQDRDAIQYVIDRETKPVMLPNGTYRLRDALICRDGMELFGESGTEILVDKDWRGDPLDAERGKPPVLSNGMVSKDHDFVRLWSTKNISIDGLTFQAESVDNQVEPSRAIEIRGYGGRIIEDVSITNVDVLSHHGTAMVLADIRGVTVKNYFVEKYTQNYGLTVKGCRGADLENITIQNPDTRDDYTGDVNGLVSNDGFEPAAEYMHRNCELYNILGGGFTTERNRKSGERLTYKHCVAEGCQGYGIKTKGERHVILEQCILRDNTGSGVMIRGGDAFDGNDRNNNGDGGDIEILHTTIEDSGENGIKSKGALDGFGSIFIHHTDIRRSGERGISLQQPGYVQIKDVTIEESTRRGLSLTGNNLDSLEIRDVTVRDAGQNGTTDWAAEIKMDGILDIDGVTVSMDADDRPNVGLYMDLERAIQIDASGFSIDPGTTSRFRLVRTSNRNDYDYDHPLISISDQNIKVEGDGPPSSGFWVKDDKVTDGTDTWVCTSTGTPGSWSLV